MSGRTADTGSATAVRAAIAMAARQLGLPDPEVAARELLEVDVDGLDQWFSVAARAQVWLWQGAGRLSDALPILAAGWSSASPGVAVTGQHEAGRASREVIYAQVDAADQTGATLRQARALAEGELARADAAIQGLGWPPGEDLLMWAAGSGQLMPVSGVVIGLCDRLGELLTRSTQALHVLAMALRADPRDPVEQLMSATAASSAATVAGSAATAGPALGALTSSTGVDQDNLDRLAADLQSGETATLTMAQGVYAALEKARSDGGTAQLLTYESANSGSQGRAAVSVGDITTADNVVVLAPGIGNAPVNLAAGISDATTIRNEAHRQAPGDATAVVAWYGYDIPLSTLGGVDVNAAADVVNTLAALDDDNARSGGATLVDDLAGYRGWAPPTARFVGMGFSMGSTTMSAAAARGAPFDDMVLMGSPGASRDVISAGEYPELPAEHTFVAAFDTDAITRTPIDVLAGLADLGPFPDVGPPFGPDPADAGFGAQVIDVPTNAQEFGGPFSAFNPVLQMTEQFMELLANHSTTNYLSGESLQAVGAVVVGQYSDVPIKPGR